MAGIAVDTHAMVWFLVRDPRLSENAGSALRAVTALGVPLVSRDARVRASQVQTIW